MDKILWLTFLGHPVRTCTLVENDVDTRTVRVW